LTLITQGPGSEGRPARRGFMAVVKVVGGGRPT